MHPTNISIQAGPYGSIAIVVRDEEGRVVGHLVRPEEAVQLASNLMELAPIIHDGHRISAGRAVATGLTAIFETDCRRGWRLLFGARPAAPAAWFRALGR